MKLNVRLAHGGAITALESAADGAPHSEGGVYRIRIIQPGQGSSGIYTPENLAESAALFRAGTHMFMDHPGRFEDSDRPERSVKDLAGRLITDAVVEADGSLTADCKVFPSFDAIIREKWDSIGVSINAWCDRPLESDGTVPPFAGVVSVDFVTKAGAGGAILDVLESQRVDEAKNNSEENHVTEEIKEAILEAMSPVTSTLEGLTARVEALEATRDEKKKPAPGAPVPPAGEDQDDDTPNEEDERKRRREALEAIRDLAESALPKAAQDRAIAAFEAGTPMADAIEAERSYINSIHESAPASTVDDSAQATLKTIHFA